MSTISGDTPALKVEQYWNGGILVVSVEGRVNSLNSPDFQHKLEAALNKESKSVILDCEQLSYISSAGLRVILITAKDLRRRESKFAACSLAQDVRAIFSMTGFDRVVAVHDSLSNAVESLQD